MMAVRFQTDGRRETIDRLAIVIVRGAIDFSSNPQEQTDEFLRIAAQMTESELELIRIIYERQAALSQAYGLAQDRTQWLHNVNRQWADMNRLHPQGSEGWMHRKSALVRLQSYGFLEQVERNITAEGSEVGQSPYALLPLGKEFCDYTMAI
jgi:hypothetical protein